MKKSLILIIMTFCLLKTYARDFNLFIGSNYIANSTIQEFNFQTQANLTQNFFNDNEEMLAKIIAGASGYDVIVATSYAVSELVNMGKIIPLDKTKLTNLNNIDPKFLNPEYDPGNKYSVPYAYTPVFLAYNQNKLNQLKIIPNSWAVIFDPKYLVRLKGRVTVFDNSRNVFAAALLYLGLDPNSQNINDLERARQVIEKARPYWAKFDSDSYYRGLVRGDIWLAMGYSIDIFKTLQDLKASHSKVKLNAMLQKEGNMIELDNMVIPVSAPHKDLAYRFINLALSSKSAYELAKFTGSSIPNSKAKLQLSLATQNLTWIYPPSMSKIYIFKAYSPQIRILVNEMWTEIKMGSECGVL